MPSSNARNRASARRRARTSARTSARSSARSSARARATATSRSRARALLDDDPRALPMMGPLARRTGAPSAVQVWLEVQGQQRLLRLHAALQLRRQLLERWSTLLDDADDRVTRRLELLGGDSLGYDTRLSDHDDDEDYGDIDDVRPRDRDSKDADDEKRPSKQASAPRATSRPRTSTRRTPTKKAAPRKR
jgi:hypothetical protein